MKKRLVSLLKRGVTSYEGRNTFVMFFFLHVLDSVKFKE